MRRFIIIVFFALLVGGSFAFGQNLDLEGKAVSVDRIWWDKGSGAHQDVTILRPRAPQNFVIIGDIVVQKHTEGGDIQGFTFRDDTRIFKKPVTFQRIWWDKGSGANEDCAVWYPVPPEGYVSLGFLATRNYEPPQSRAFRCVRKEFATLIEKHGTQVWNDGGSKADQDVAFWKYVHLPVIYYYAVQSHKQLPKNPVGKLNIPINFH